MGSGPPDRVGLGHTLAFPGGVATLCLHPIGQERGLQREKASEDGPGHQRARRWSNGWPGIWSDSTIGAKSSGTIKFRRAECPATGRRRVLAGAVVFPRPKQLKIR